MMGYPVRAGFKSWFDMSWAAPNACLRHRMDRVAYLTEFLPEIRIGLKQDFPWLTGTALGGECPASHSEHNPQPFPEEEMAPRMA